MTSGGGFFQTVLTTFLASIKSVGTACTLASVGIYLHQRGFVVGNGKRTLALISQQVTIPLLFFTKILYCNQDWSPEPCPNVTDSLKDVWILLIWPLWVCVAGICVGYCVTLLGGVPSHQRNYVLASVAFGNSTGLPITLLTVIHSNFGPSSALGSVDPTLFLSVYLILYPVLQWGIGGMLLAPPTNPVESEKEKDGESSIEETNRKDSDYEIDNQMKLGITSELSFKSSLRRNIKVELDRTKMTLYNTQKTLANNVIHKQDAMPKNYRIKHRGLDTTDASLYWSVHENLNRWGKPQYGSAPPGSGVFDSTLSRENSRPKLFKSALTTSGQSIGMDISEQEFNQDDCEETTNRILPVFLGDINEDYLSSRSAKTDEKAATTEATALLGTTTNLLNDSSSESEESSSSQRSNDREKLLATLSKVVKRCFQPPVIAALLGLLFASFPTIRGILVDIDDRNGDAPLQWFFDGLFEAGRAAVPINMIILGCNLSASYMLHSPSGIANPSSNYSKESNGEEHGSTRFDSFGTRTTLFVVAGKMIIMPFVGYISTLGLSTFYAVSHEIAGSLYLVLLIVFLCPTANNVMVMVELGGGGTSSKESMARIIAYQYAIAPLVLSGTVTGAVLMASAMAEYYQTTPIVTT